MNKNIKTPTDLRIMWDSIYDSIGELMQEFSEDFDEYEENFVNAINDSDKFISMLENEGLMNKDLSNFIERYMRYYNE